MKSMLVSSFRKYSISFSKRFFSPQTWGGSRGLKARGDMARVGTQGGDRAEGTHR